MKKIIYTLVALAFSSATFAQFSKGNAVKSDEFYPGAIFNEKSLKGLEPQKLLTATETSVVILPSSLLEDSFEISDYSKENWHAIIDKYYAKLSKATQNESFSFSTPSQVYSLKYLDKDYNTYESIKNYFGVEEITSKNLFFGKSEQILFSFLVIDPINKEDRYISKEALEKIKEQDPILIQSVSFGKRADILIASNKLDTEIRTAFNIYRSKETQRYKEADQILADASVHIILFGKNNIDTSNLTNQEIILAYIDFITKPAVKEDYYYPIKYEGLHLNNRMIYQSDIMQDSYK